MAESPSTENFTLGKGVLYFEQKIGGVSQGERDLGNAPAFSYSVSLDHLEHYSSRGGLKALDKDIISQVTPEIKFTLDEINKENFAMTSLGSIAEITQSAGSVVKEAITAHLDRRSQLAFRNVGAKAIPVSAITTAFVPGEIVTGATSTATATVISSTSASILVVNQSGTFAAESLTGSIAGAATATGDSIFASGSLLIQDATDTTTYVAGTDYEIDTTLKDDVIGRVKILSGSIVEGDVLHVTYEHGTATYTEIKAFASTTLEGQVRFISDNPVGTNSELNIWNVSLSPDGDTSMIGEDWSTLGFTGKVLRDVANHPDSPYYTMILA